MASPRARSQCWASAATDLSGTVSVGVSTFTHHDPVCVVCFCLYCKVRTLCEGGCGVFVGAQFWRALTVVRSSEGEQSARDHRARASGLERLNSVKCFTVLSSQPLSALSNQISAHAHVIFSEKRSNEQGRESRDSAVSHSLGSNRLDG